MLFFAQYIETFIFQKSLSILNASFLLTIIVATEKESDKLNGIKNKKIVAFILILVLTISVIPVNAQSNESKKVILGGTPFGLKIFTNGVIIIEIDDNNSPAKKAGLKINDIITQANDITISNNEQLKRIIENSDGEPIKLTLTRDERVITKSITPVLDNNMNYVAGMWIRDSTAGIGTVTYFDYNNHTFGGLGHGICDKDTKLLMPLKNGEIMSATISNCTKASDGVVGGLNGYFDSSKLGTITANDDFGIYGTYETTTNSNIIEVAQDREICIGKASIISTIDSSGPKEYEVEITNVNVTKNSGQNLIIKVTDEELLEKTGGIIQGMSGSPIIQNNKLVGAVTHVFINTPEKGYGISINNMLRQNT